MERWIRVLAALGLGLALAVTSSLGYGPIGFASGLVVLAFAFGWPRLTDSPQPRLTSITLALFGMLGMASVWLSPVSPYLEWLPILAGISLLWAFVQHLLRGIEASDAVANVSAEVAGIVITLSACTWIATLRLPTGNAPIFIGLAAIFLAQCATALPWPARYTSPLAGIMGLIGAGIAFLLVPQKPAVAFFTILLYGLLLGAIVAATDRVLGMVARAKYQARDLSESRRLTKTRNFGVQLAMGAAPIALSGFAVYAATRLPLWSVLWF